MRATLLLSSLLITCAACGDDGAVDDAGFEDAARDSGFVDSGPADRGVVDTGIADAGSPDAVVDAGVDAGDSGPGDTGPNDAGPRVVDVVVAYTATAETPLLAELYLTESSALRTKVTPPLRGGPQIGGKGEPNISGVIRFAWAHGNTGLVYNAQQDTFDQLELYYAPTPNFVVTGTTSELSLRGVPDEARGFRMLPGSDWLLFNQVSGTSFGSLFAVRSSTASSPQLISQGALATFASSSPTAAQVVFQDIIVSADDRDLWFADLDVAPPRTERVNPGAFIGFNRVANWASDGSELLYVADENASRVFELYRVTITNGALGPRTQVLPTLAADRDIEDGVFSPDLQTIAIIGDLTTNAISELYTIDANAASPTLTTISGTFAGGVGSGVERVLFSPDSSQLLYIADQDTMGVEELFVAQPGAANSGVRVHTSLAAGRVSGEQWLDDSTVLYLAGDGPDRRLYINTVAGGVPGTPVPVGPNSFGLHEFSPSGRYLLIQDSTPQRGLHLADLSQSPPTVQALGGIGWCWGAGDTLAIISDADDPNKLELFLVENFAAPTLFKISGPLIADGVVTACAFPR